MTLPTNRITSYNVCYTKLLRKTYRGGVEALKGIDLSVQQGDFYALLGPNGAGT